VDHGESNCDSVQTLSDMFFQDMDADGDGSVDFNEFKLYVASHKDLMASALVLDGGGGGDDAEEVLVRSFARFDEDGNGRLDKSEFRAMMLATNMHASEESEALRGHLNEFADLVFKEVDFDNSGLIDFDEYRKRAFRPVLPLPPPRRLALLFAESFAARRLV